MAGARNPEKARRYISSLDTARCNGNWHEVPELVRKVAKHAPEKKCLIHAARAECQIAEHVKKTADSTDPSTVPGRDGLLELIPTLLSAMEEDGDSSQDVFQAQVCLGWLHWSLSEPSLAASRLPKDFEVTLQTITGNGQTLSHWTEVCIIKGGYVKAMAQESASGTDDALQTFDSVLRWIYNSSPASSPQYSLWLELFLAKSATLASGNVANQDNPSFRTIDLGLRAFRAWASHCDVKRTDPASKPSIWKAYYLFLSDILQRRLPYTGTGEGSRRVQLSSEFRRVETVCENILLKKMKFPKAHSTNHQVEEWVEQVIRNWEVLCGPEWSDEDFGEGGQDAVSRNVLDILYRAATKTFHSTLILRRLFHVHAALAEFELSMKALDTYIDLVTNAKRRAEESQKELEHLEDDGTFMRTLSEGIITLCCFGPRKEAGKANELTDHLEKLLDSLSEQQNSDSQPEGDNSPESSYTTSDGKPVSVSAVAASYQAVGIGLANWARWTPAIEARTYIQETAATALEKSLAMSSGHGTDAPTAFALGLLLAEMRDLDGAIDQVRSTLRTANVADDASNKSITSSEEHDHIPLWHLLALLLSARQEFETANGVCEAALDLDLSRARSPGAVGTRNTHEGSEDGRRGAFTIGACDSKSRHKEGLVEVRMTQLALTEILHGPEAALNHSDELFSLFGRLFTGLGVTETEEKPKAERLAPPKSSAGTTRSFRASIFGRKKNQQFVERGLDTRSNGTNAARPSTPPQSEPHSTGGTPAIQVTNEEPKSPGKHSETSPRSRQKLHRRPGSLAKAVKAPSSESSSPIPSPSSSPMRMSPTTGHGGSLTAKQTLPPIAHNMKYNKEPQPAGHASQPPQQDVRLPANNRFDSPTRAVTRFSRPQAQKHALGLLVRIWLFVSGLYRRALLFEDAREALSEASEKASRIETLVGAQDSSAKALCDAGWGGARSSDEVWADVYAEGGFLEEAQSQPHEAMKHFEEALIYCPDHARATVGLANLLLNMYDATLPAGESHAEVDAGLSTLSLLSTAKPEKQAKSSTYNETSNPAEEDTPEEFNRLAARDRAYGLLSTLTKLGSAWDNSEAWFALSRAYEQGGEVERAEEILWWCVELEDRRPVRHWWDLGSGGYVL